MTTILSGSDGRIKRDEAFRAKLALFTILAINMETVSV